VVVSEDRLRRWAGVPLAVTLAAYGGQFAMGYAFGSGSTADALEAVGFALMVALFPLTGLLIMRRQPANRIGWLLAAIGVAWSSNALAAVVVDLGYHGSDGGPGWARIAAVLNSGLWAPPIVLMGCFLILLFPDGRLPSPRWRIPAWVFAIDALMLPIVFALQPGSVDDEVHPPFHNPIGLAAARPVLVGLAAVGLPLVPLSIVAAALAMVLRFRRSTGVQRVQLKWLMTAGAGIAAVYGITMAFSLAYLSSATPGWLGNLQGVAGLVFCLIPIAIGIAITRHGLYGIDALISRALTSAALGAFITAVYVAVVVGLGSAIGQRRPSVWLSVLATALVAVAFQPVRERVHRLVNRVVYGARATPYEVLSDFAGQLAGQFTTGELLPRLAQTVAECLGGGRVEIWLWTADGLTREASWQAGGEEAPSPVPYARPGPGLSAWAALPDAADLGADRVVPVRHRDELLGAIAVSTHAHEPLTPTDEAMLEQVASQAGLVLRNLRLVEDLQRSRQRLVTSQDDERRRLERDLHDGAQQSLVSVAIQLQLAEAQEDDEHAVTETLVSASGQLKTAIAELRELAHGIHPAILTERGVGPAVASLAARSAVPVQVDTDLERRLSPTVEATLYFVVAEALANVGKYAHARQVQVTVRDGGNEVVLTVQDDGVGGADLGRGTGLLGLTDRLAVVDGTLEVHSPDGEGTLLTCRVPARQSEVTAVQASL